MRRFFVKNILFVIAVNVLVKPLWVLFIDRTVQNKVPTTDYGTYQALLNLSIILNIVLDFGITSYNTRTIARHPGKLALLFPSMLSARLLLCGVYMVLTYGLGIVLGYRGWELNMLAGVMVIQSLNALVSFMRSNIAALQRFKIDGVLSVTDRLLMIVICGVLLLNPASAAKFKIEWFIGTQVLCYLATAVAGYIIVQRITKADLKLSFQPRKVWHIMRQSLPYAVLIFQMSVYNRADTMILERWCSDGKEQAAIWASAFRQLDMANMLGLMFATMLLPMYGNMLARKQNVQPIVKLCVNLLLPASVGVAVAGVLYSSEIMQLLYKGAAGQNTVVYGRVFSWLIASFPAWSMMYIYCTLLTANGNLKLLNYIALGGVVLNLSMNFILIPKYEATGGAITSFVTQTALAIAFIVFSRIKTGTIHTRRWIAAQITCNGTIIVIAYGLYLLPSLNWYSKLSLTGVATVALMFVFRMVSAAGIKQLANRE